jgi:hypothetical protein
MPPAQDDDDRNARQIEALRRYVAELGTNREQRPEGETVHEEYDKEEQPYGRRLSPLLPWLVLTALLVAAALIGGVLIGAARENGQEAGAGGRAGSAEATTTTLTAPVASPECKTAVDRTNGVLAVAVRMRAALAQRTTVASGEPARFDRALAEYRQIVDRCTLRTP